MFDAHVISYLNLKKKQQVPVYLHASEETTRVRYLRAVFKIQPATKLHCSSFFIIKHLFSYKIEMCDGGNLKHRFKILFIE